ncbi:ABC transporter substrate-binding protein [Mesorhizobium sp. Z1-4]|uniref:ABC transporter substrate-binding protein n=1 Tax=Mesorhizobium sp. Z1-4 TaxID=2448478 RepID=UPI0013DE95A6|nr:ABC transporter substrate-binding protein [Mesorhizobium sp. Z1-4]
MASAPALAEAPSLKGEGEIVFPTLGGSWEDALKRAFFEPFTAETGIEVVIVPEDHAKLMASTKAGQPYADLTSLSGGMLEAWVRDGILGEIDYKYFDPEVIENIPEVWRRDHGVGRVVYSMVMAWNTDAYKTAPANWAEFFDQSKFSGPRGFAACDKIVDGADLEIALMADGVPFDEIYPIDMDRAFAKLESLKKDVSKWWTSGSQQAQGLVAGEFDATTAYNGRIYRAIKDGAPVNFTWNQSVQMYDYMVVMKDSPNYDNVMKFMAFFSRPDRQAEYARIQTGGPTNAKTFEYVDAELAKWLPGNPEHKDKVLVQDYSWWAQADEQGRTNWERAVERCTKLLSN